MEAFNCGLRAIGIYDGYRDLAPDERPSRIELTFDDVSRIHSSGGSILRTSRTNPAADEATLERCVASLDALGLPLSRVHRRRRYDLWRGAHRRARARTHRRRDGAENDRQRSAVARKRADLRLRNRALRRRGTFSRA